MTSENENKIVEQVNEDFYRALSTRDIELMGKVWVQDSRAKCVHPGWTALNGWDAIRQSWESVFDPSDQLDIEVSNLAVEVNGDSAWVMCIQKLTYVNRYPAGVNMSLSTNIFIRSENGWKMVVHHASPLPMMFHEQEGESLQ